MLPRLKFQLPIHCFVSLGNVVINVYHQSLKTTTTSILSHALPTKIKLKLSWRKRIAQATLKNFVFCFCNGVVWHFIHKKQKFKNSCYQYCLLNNNNKLKPHLLPDSQHRFRLRISDLNEANRAKLFVALL